MERPDVLIAKVIGQPIDSSLPVPVVISEIADIETAEPGEDVYVWNAYDDNVDTIYTAGNDGELVSVKKGAVAATLLTFAGLQTDLAYVTVNEVLNAKDQTAVARKKAAITRGMDKEEVVRLINVILGIASQEIEGAGKDLYDIVMDMYHLVEDYGDDFILLVGSTVSEKIDTYDKDNVANFHYRIGLKETLANLGIKKVKVVGKVKLDGGAYSPVLAAKSGILVARNSQLKVGKPCLHVRRKINPDIAANMGANPEEAYRFVSVAQTPTVINNSKNILGYGVFGFESIVEAVTNFKAIAWSDSMLP
jgi:hypothetical protein